MAAKKIDLSIVVPCYNEKNNISLVVKRFLEIKPKSLDVELILVDNGSADNSKAVMEKFDAKQPKRIIKIGRDFSSIRLELLRVRIAVNAPAEMFRR